MTHHDSLCERAVNPKHGFLDVARGEARGGPQKSDVTLPRAP